MKRVWTYKCGVPFNATIKQESAAMAASSSIDAETSDHPDEATATKTSTATSSSQTSLIRTLYVFTVAFFVCIIAFFYTRDVKTGIIRLQDILTMLNPLLLIPLFYVIFLVDVDQLPNARMHIVFLLVATVYIHGDGYHLAANAIHRYEEGLVGEDLQDVVYLYDEELGHYYPYSGLVGLHLLWLYRQSQLPFDETFSGCSTTGLILFGLIHGFVLFITFIEGKFAIPAIIFFALVAAYGVFQRKRLRSDPIFLFTLAYGVTGLILMVVWAIWQGGFPELTEAGVV